MRFVHRAALAGVLLALVNAGAVSAGDEPESLVADLPAAFDTLAGRVVLTGELARVAEEERDDAWAAALERLERDEGKTAAHRRASRERGEAVTRIAEAFSFIAGHLKGGSAMENDLRAFLVREDTPDVAFDAWIGGKGEQDPARIILDHTRLGRALHREDDGSWTLNPHAVWDLDDLLQELVKRAALRMRLLAVVPDAEFVRRTLAETRAVEVDAVAAFRKRYLADATPSTEVEALGAEIPLVRAELEAEGARSVLDLGSGEYDASGLDLLRSSVFYNPRTRAGAFAYATEFENHFAARLFGTWGWNAKVSKNEADLVERLRKQKTGLASLAKTHDKLIVHISGVPPWLSTHGGNGVFEGGGWEDKQAHPPKDLATWKRLITELAQVFREIEGVDRYYEFWNEPDLEYWQGTIGEFLELYAVTARTIREADPEGRIGGAAPNQWDGRIHKKTGSDCVNLELIRYAKEHDLPLDFVSWHHFGRPLAAIAEAKAAYLAEWRKVGLEGEPEWLVTEWSSPSRGTPYANIPFAEHMLAFRAAGVDVQTVSCWEEFHAKPDPKGFAPWGLMTQQAHRKSRWWVHLFFDRLARGSEGVAVMRDSAERTIVASKKADGLYDLLVWQEGTAPRLAAAWAVLQEKGFGREPAAKAFRVGDRLERAIAAGEPPAPEWADAFGAAKQAYDAQAVRTPRLVLELQGAEAVEVVTCEAVRMAHEAARPVTVHGNVVACAISPQEVVHLVLRVR